MKGIINKDGYGQELKSGQSPLCFRVYLFARPDSVIDGLRFMKPEAVGGQLAREFTGEADGGSCSDTGIAMAGFAEASGIPMTSGL